MEMEQHVCCENPAEPQVQWAEVSIKTKKEIAAMFSVSPRTIDNWVTNLGFPVLQITPGVVRFSQEHSEKWALEFMKASTVRKRC